MILSGCSTAKVHLYSRYMSEQEVTAVSEQLIALDYEVEVNTLSFPDEVTQSTLLYSPFMEGKSGVDDLLTAMNDLGWKISTVQPLFAGNHYYTKNSAGLLLLPEGGMKSDKVKLQDLQTSYQANDCNQTIVLQLKQGGHYQLVYEDNTQTSKPNHLTGTWRVTSYPYLELTSLKGEWRHYFQIEKSLTKDVVGEIELVELKLLEQHHIFPNCNFSVGLRR